MVYGVSLGAMFMLQKLCQDISGINTMHLFVVRQLCIFIGGYIHGKANGEDFSRMGWKEFKMYPYETRKLILLRCIFDWAAGVLLVFAVMLMPVSLSLTISRLSMFFTPLFAFLIDKEVVSVHEVLTIAIGFLGILMVMNPTWFSNGSGGQAADIKKREEHDQEMYPYYYAGLIMTVLFAMVAAMGVIFIRVLNKRSDQKVPSSMQVYYYGLITTCLMCLASFYISPDLYAFWNLFSKEYTMSLAQFAWYCSLGLFCWLYTWLATMALQHVKSSVFVPFTNVAIVMSFIFDIFYFGRTMFWSDYAGAGLIIFGTVAQSKLAEKNS